MTLETTTTRKRLLIAEDDPVTKQLLRRLLQKLDCDVEVVGDGEEVVRAVAEGCFDAVLMDMYMPRMDGIQATRKIREAEAAGQPRSFIIGISASKDFALGELGCNAGLDRLVAKPVCWETLTDIIDSLPTGTNPPTEKPSAA